jgi:hypothetical protein
MRFWRRYRTARAVKLVSHFRPRLEGLEDRCVPNIDMVTNLSGVFLDPGSLPYEVGNAAPGDTIQFAANLNGGTIFLKNPLDIATNLTIDGAGSGITVTGGGAHPVIQIDTGVVATINALSITGGFAPGATGGGIDNKGSLSLNNSTVSGNSAASGGGIFNDGFLSLSKSTVTGNAATSGAGIYNDGAGTMIMSGDTVNNNTATAPTGHGGGVDNFGHLTIINCTIAANLALQGGGIYNGDVLNVVNSTVASNTVTGTGADGGGIYTVGQLSLLNTIVFNPNSGAATKNDVLGTIALVQGDLFGSGVSIASGGDLGGNQFTANPLLGPLQNNGGPTATMALLPGSKAIAAGAGASLIPGLSVPVLDQRGEPRPANSIDIGALQTEVPPPLGFIQDLYNDFLGRNGAPSEWNGWVSVLPTLGPAAVAYAISHSPEALTHSVDGFYVKFLGRQAVGGEEGVWVAALEHGATEEQVIAVILSSPEFAARANALIGGANTDANYVQALYMLLLNRTASTADVNTWLAALPNGRVAVALAFLGSQEYRTDVVTQLYGTLLDRPTAPPASAVAGWVNSGLDILAIEVVFASSAEYFQNG